MDNPCLFYKKTKNKLKPIIIKKFINQSKKVYESDLEPESVETASLLSTSEISDNNSSQSCLNNDKNTEKNKILTKMPTIKSAIRSYNNDNFNDNNSYSNQNIKGINAIKSANSSKLSFQSFKLND